MTSPYDRTATEYLNLGWSPLPLPSERKAPPPAGFTGWDGEEPSADQVADWIGSGEYVARAARNGTPPAIVKVGNVALRADRLTLGVDVDAYDGKTGGKTLATMIEAHGELPPTWRTTSRGADNPSGIYWFRLIDEAEPGFVRGSLGGIETIHFGHRYAVAPPSIHDKTGKPYQWIGPDGAVALVGPHVADLPIIPAAHLAHFRGDCGCEANRTEAGGQSFTREDSSPQGQFDRAVAAIESGQSRHDTTAAAIFALVGYATPEAVALLDRLRGIYVEALAPERGGRKAVEAEWRRMVDGAGRKAEPWASNTLPNVSVSDSAGWQPIDLAAVAAAGLEPIEPDLFFREDGIGLLYSGKLNTLFGSPEGGKSLVGLMVAKRLIDAAERSEVGIPVVYIDFEDSPKTFLARLRDMGTPPDVVARRARYYSARHAISSAPDGLLGLAEARLVVIDTTNAAMTLDGLDPISNADALRFVEHVKRFTASTDAAVVLIDHEPMSADRSRRQSLGAQGKFASVNGAQYRVTATEQPRPGSAGQLSLHVTKDRNGGVRKHSAPPTEPGVQHAATVFLDPVPKMPGDVGDPFDFVVMPPNSTRTDSQGEALRLVLAKMRENPEQQWTKNQMADAIGKRKKAVLEAIDDGVSRGLIAAEPHGNSTRFYPLPTGSRPPEPATGSQTPEPPGTGTTQWPMLTGDMGGSQHLGTTRNHQVVPVPGSLEPVPEPGNRFEELDKRKAEPIPRPDPAICAYRRCSAQSMSADGFCPTHQPFEEMF